MNKDELVAEKFLLSMNNGEVRFEPDGNFPPDFTLGNGIAVEVRRLNENVKVDGKLQGLESADIALGTLLRAVLDEFGAPPLGQSKYYVKYGFKRPLKSFRKIKEDLRNFFQKLRDNPNVSRRANFPNGMWVEVLPASYPAENQFRPAIVVDDDSGGETVQLLKNNIESCILEKNKKIAPFRMRYPCWWLVLIDHIDFGIDEFNRIQFRKEFQSNHGWDKIFLVDPRDATNFFEL